MRCLSLLIILICATVASAQQYTLSKKEVRQLVKNVKKDLRTINDMLEEKTITTDDIKAALEVSANTVKQKMLNVMLTRIDKNTDKLQRQFPYLKSRTIKKIVELGNAREGLVTTPSSEKKKDTPKLEAAKTPDPSLKDESGESGSEKK